MPIDLSLYPKLTALFTLPEEDSTTSEERVRSALEAFNHGTPNGLLVLLNLDNFLEEPTSQVLIDSGLLNANNVLNYRAEHWHRIRESIPTDWTAERLSAAFATTAIEGSIFEAIAQVRNTVNTERMSRSEASETKPVDGTPATVFSPTPSGDPSSPSASQSTVDWEASPSTVTAF